MRARSHLAPLIGANRQSVRLSFVLAGFVSIGVAMLSAMASIPDDINEADALFLPALYLTIGLIVPIVLQLRSDLRAALRVENVLMIGLVYWLLMDMLQSAYPFQSVTSASLQLAFGVVGAFALAMWLGASGQGWPLPRAVISTASREFDTTTIYSATLIAFVLGMADFTISSGFDPAVMLKGLGAPRWYSPWVRGNLGGASAFLDHMTYFGYILPSLCVVMAVRVGWVNWRVISGLLLSAIVLAFLSQSGGRRIIGVVVGAALFTLMASRPRLGPKIIIWCSVVLVVLLMFMQEMLRFRNVGFAAWWAGESPDAIDDFIHVDDNFLRLAQLINLYPRTADYVLYQPLLHALTLPIPRVFWPGKPTGPGFDLPALLGLNGLSLSVSIIGELYVSYGLGAVIAGGWVLGRIAGMWNKILQLPSGASRPLMYALGLMALFAGLRSMQALVQMSYIVLAWMVLTNLLRKFSRSAYVENAPRA
jgi:hypothetical protein